MYGEKLIENDLLVSRVKILEVELDCDKEINENRVSLPVLSAYGQRRSYRCEALS